MKAFRKVLVALIIAIVAISLVFLSAQLQVTGPSNGSENEVSLTEATKLRPVRDDAVTATSRTEDHNQSHVAAIQSIPIRRQQSRNAIKISENSDRKSRTEQRLSRRGDIEERMFASGPSVKQVLEFVHITKTGGTAIEIAAAAAGFKWGSCHWRFQRGYGFGCRRPDWRNERTLRKDIPIPKFQGEFWHTPPAWFQSSPYQGTPTFSIVRNPYDRIVSEFYCPYFGYYRGDSISKFPNPRQAALMLQQREAHGRLKHGWNGPELKDESTPEQIMVDHRRDKQATMRGQRQSRLPPPTALIFNRWIRRALNVINPSTGHMLAQYLYICDTVNGTSHQVVDYVLKYETLHQEFAKLMTKYRLERVRLSHYQPLPLDLMGRDRFTVADLDPSTICMINQRYAQDFEFFGYPIKSCGKLDENATIDMEPKEIEFSNQAAF